MINHEEKAHELFKQGYNCAQSVFAAFCDVTGIDFETAIKLTSGFGAGMGGMRDTCNTVADVHGSGHALRLHRLTGHHRKGGPLRHYPKAC